jgi:hypothetical protein
MSVAGLFRRLTPVLGMTLFLPAPALAQVDDYREYGNVTEWVGNVSYVVTDQWNGSVGAARYTAEQVETGTFTLNLDQPQPIASGQRWKGKGSGEATRRLRQTMSTPSATVEHTFDASAQYPVPSADLTLDYSKAVFTLSTPSIKAQFFDLTTRSTSGGGTKVSTIKHGFTPRLSFAVGHALLQKPSQGTALSGGRTGDDGGYQSINLHPPLRPTSRFDATWTFAPVWGDLSLVVRIPGYEQWVPDGGPDGATPGNEFTVHAELIGKGGQPPPQKVKKFHFELLNTSRQPGNCLNWPAFSLPDPAMEPFDLRFDLARNPGTAFTSGSLQSVATTAAAPSLKGSCVVSCYDWGAWCELRVTAELTDRRMVVGHLEGHPTLLQIPIPKRKQGSRIADAWKAALNIDKPDDWDEDAKPAGPAVPGDGLTLFEEYRGVFEKKTGKHVRLDPNEMEMFVIDPDDLLDPDLWKARSGITAVLLTKDQHRNQRVNFNSSGRPKYAVHLFKVAGRVDPLGLAKDPSTWGQTDGAVADQAVNCRIFPDRPADGLRNVLPRYVREALRDPNSAEGKHLYGQGFDKPMLQQTDRALADAARVDTLLKRLVRLAVVHELGHACAVDHHDPDIRKGEMSCIMRSLGDYDLFFRMAGELRNPTTDPLPLGARVFCTAPDNCVKSLRLKPK